MALVLICIFITVEVEDKMNYLAAEVTGAELVRSGLTNMLVGLFVVFAVLTFLTLIISAFKLLNKVGTAEEQPPKAAPAKAPVPGVASAADFSAPVPAGPGKMAAAKVAFQDEIDGETAAVILAAVAQELGGNFKVTSIKKSK